MCLKILNFLWCISRILCDSNIKLNVDESVIFLSLHIFLSLPVKVPSPSDLRVTNFSDSDITVRWEAAADDVVSYLIKWISLSGGDLRQVRLI